MAINAHKIETLISVDEAIRYRESLSTEKQVAFIPTMGALHQGHLNLIRHAKANNRLIFVSIFVNPAQFGPNEDFSRYPRTLEQDVALLTQEKIDALFLPTAASMYPPNYSTYVSNNARAADLCGLTRPQHFQGVLTIVLKLFNILKPHIAFFGKKDYQQLYLIKKMADDLNLSTKIIGVETLRDPDGLALSSRNVYLSKEDRIIAPQIYGALKKTRDFALQDTKNCDPEKLLNTFLKFLEPFPQLKLEYVELRRQKDLSPVSEAFFEPAVLLTAVRLGATRLIDNIEINLNET